MGELTIDFDPELLHISSGHFHESTGYGTLRRRGSRSWLIVLTVSGHGRFRAGDRDWMTSAGDVALLRPRTTQEYGVPPEAERWELRWSHFHPRPHWEPLLEGPTTGPGLALQRLANPDDRQYVEDGLAEAWRHELRGGHADVMLAMNALERVLIRLAQVRSTENRRDPRIQAAVDLAVAEHAAGVSLAAMAEAAGLSPSRFGHLFTAEVGEPPRVFLERQRISRAAQLLAMTSLPVREVADSIGFENEFYFSSRFRRATGLSPTAYRRQSRRAEGA